MKYICIFLITFFSLALMTEIGETTRHDQKIRFAGGAVAATEPLGADTFIQYANQWSGVDASKFNLTTNDSDYNVMDTQFDARELFRIGDKLKIKTSASDSFFFALIIEVTQSQITYVKRYAKDAAATQDITALASYVAHATGTPLEVYFNRVGIPVDFPFSFIYYGIIKSSAGAQIAWGSEGAYYMEYTMSDRFVDAAVVLGGLNIGISTTELRFTTPFVFVEYTPLAYFYTFMGAKVNLADNAIPYGVTYLSSEITYPEGILLMTRKISNSQTFATDADFEATFQMRFKL
jgi:hypothetical protein